MVVLDTWLLPFSYVNLYLVAVETTVWMDFRVIGQNLAIEMSLFDVRHVRRVYYLHEGA